jgi:glucose repression regulatory protein TUP1
LKIFEGHTEEIYCLDFSRDGRLIVSGSGDRTARVWELEDKKRTVFTIPMNDEGVSTPDGGVTSVAVSHDSRLLAAGSLDSMTRVWDIATGQLLARLKGHMDSVYSVTFSADGRGLITGSLDKTLKHWDIMPIIRRVQQGPKMDRTALVSPEKPASLQSTIDLVGHKVYYLHCMFMVAPLNATARISY